MQGRAQLVDREAERDPAVSNALPLLSHRGMDAVLAYRGREAITVGRFLCDVRALAQRLPERTHMLNLCEDPYRFMSGLAAGVMRGQCSLLPPNRSPQTLQRTRHACRASYALVEAPLLEPAIETLPWSGASSETVLTGEVPTIAGDHVAVMAFTSGSTGAPQPHAKTWASLVRSAEVESMRLGVAGRAVSLVGTVPAQHMYGLESLVLLCLQGGNAVFAGRPFYPHDIAAALASVPAPRVLVTTPVHLRALLATAVELAEVDLILSATAPLSRELAAQAESRFDTRVLEIYGCTEAGQIASRRTTEGDPWLALDGLTVRREGGQTMVGGGHLAQWVPLSDDLELLSERAFLLRGRSTDTLNIAGKRASLAELNQRLTEIEGVIDGCFYMPEERSAGVTRLTAFVVAPGVPKERILRALRASLDPAFLPRPLFRVESLGRNETGKLPIEQLRRLYRSRTAAE